MKVLTREINEYEQDGEYFCGIFETVPTMVWMLANTRMRDSARQCDVSVEEYHGHVLSGGGRLKKEEEWYFLCECDVIR